MYIHTYCIDRGLGSQLRHPLEDLHTIALVRQRRGPGRTKATRTASTQDGPRCSGQRYLSGNWQPKLRRLPRSLRPHVCLTTDILSDPFDMKRMAIRPAGHPLASLVVRRRRPGNPDNPKDVFSTEDGCLGCASDPRATAVWRLSSGAKVINLLIAACLR